MCSQGTRKKKNDEMLLPEGNSASSSMLDQEDAQRKNLVDNMVQNPNSNGPIVKVLSNVQGNYLIKPS